MDGPPSQQTVANPDIYASTRQKRTGEPQHPLRESEDEPYQGNLRNTAIRRAIQTYSDGLTRDFGLFVQRNKASLIQELEEVSPRLINSERPESSSGIAPDKANTRRICSHHLEAVTFRLKLQLPAWFSSRVWEFARVDAQQGWNLYFRAYNQRPNNAQIFVCCDNGDFYGARQLIDKGEASILDITASGENLLSLSLRGFSDDESLLTDEQACAAYDRHGLVKWLLETEMSLDETNGSAALYACCSHPCGNAEICGHILRPVIDYVYAKLGYRAIQWLWALCAKSDSLEFLTHRLQLSAHERAHLNVDLLKSSESAAIYVAKLRLSTFGLLSTYSGLEHIESPLHHVARFLGCDLPGIDRESWMRIGVDAIRDGAGLHVVQRDNNTPCTPMLQLLREFVPDPARYPHRFPVELFLGRLDVWVRMLTAAHIDLEEYFAAERKIWKQFRSRIAFGPRLERGYSTKMVRVGFSPEKSACTIHVRNQATMTVAQLHHLPGSFQPRPVGVPHTICWAPTVREREEGHWSVSRKYAESYYGLLNTTQDDNGTLMRVLRMSHRDRRSCGRSSSQPVPQRRRLFDYENRPTSSVHRWLPRYHYCHARSTWVVSGHHTPIMSVPPEPDSSFIDPINCAKDNVSPYDAFEITKQQTPGGFLRDIINCRAGNFIPRADPPYTVPLHLRHNYLSWESGAGTTCPQGCSRVNPDRLEKACDLPEWHPGFLTSRVGTQNAIRTVASSQVSGLWERLF
jgi:hypothetical protein